MKVLGALESAQLEWFTDAGKPAASSYVYRVIYVSDLKQIQVSDGTNWIPFVNTSTSQTLSGDITFAGQQIFNGLHRLSVTTNISSGALIALAPITPVTEFTGAVTSVSGITSGVSGATVMLINRSGSPFTVIDENTGAIAVNRIRTGTGASITLTNNASILLTYAGDNRWHIVNGSGSSSSSGSKNYFSISSANPNFSQNSTSPWSACTLTLSSGIPSGTPTLSATQMAIATTGTNPLLVSQSNYNLQLTKSAANAQGQGFISGSLTVDREDLAKVLTGSFYYEVVSGTVDFSGSSTQSLEIWIYNTVSGVWTQPAGYRGINQSSGSGVVTFTFQTDSTAANNTYKIAVITAQTSTSSYVVNFNDFKIGPQTSPIGVPMSDWVSYTPTFQGFGTPSTIECQWRRVGDSVQIKGKFIAGTATAVEARMSLPSGLTSADTTKIPSIQYAGSAALNAVSAAIRDVLIEPSVTYLTFGQQSSTTAGLTKDTGSNITGTGVGISFVAQVPIAGWSSNVQLSNDTDTRIVELSAYTASSTTVTSGTATIFTTVGNDTHSAYNTVTGQYTVSVSGIYQVSFTPIATTAAGIDFSLYKNGAFAYGTVNNSRNGYASSAYFSSGTRLIKCNAGDILTIVPQASGTLNSTSISLEIARLSGPSVIASAETVTASYYLSANFAASTTVPINFDTKEFDSHNAVTTSATAWKFIAPVSGTYLLTLFAGVGTNSSVLVYKNGSAYKTMQYMLSASNGISGANSIKLLAGDYIDFRPNASVTIGGGVQSGANTSNITITRTGNY